MRITVVHWLDASGYHGEMGLGDVNELKALPIVTVGMLISEDDIVIRLAQDFLRYAGSPSEHRYRDIETIPKKYIEHMEVKEFEAFEFD